MRRIVLASALLACVAQAQAQAGEFFVRGDGAMPCAYLNANIGRAEILARVEGWVEGYLTARNQMAGGAFDVAGGQKIEAVIAAVQRACRTNPEGVLFEVTQSAITMVQRR
jgi:hypothetical protein